ENVGDMQFYLQAEPNDFVTLGTDQATEQKKVDDWRKSNPTLTIDEFNRMPPAAGGPATGLQWYPYKQRSDQVSVAENERPIVPLMRPRPKTPGVADTAWTFSGRDL